MSAMNSALDMHQHTGFPGGDLRRAATMSPTIDYSHLMRQYEGVI